MVPIVYEMRAMVTTLTMPSKVVCVVVSMLAMVKTLMIVMAALINSLVAILNLNIIAGCIFQ